MSYFVYLSDLKGGRILLLFDAENLSYYMWQARIIELINQGYSHLILEHIN